MTAFYTRASQTDMSIVKPQEVREMLLLACNENRELVAFSKVSSKPLFIESLRRFVEQV